MTDQIWILLVFVLYFSAIIGLAIRFRKSQNLTDYFLGGRKLNTWVGALSAQTSDMSGWLLMGLPGAIYAFGTGRAWIAVGLIVGTVLNWCFVAKRLRRATIVFNNSVTLPEYLENRFYDKSHVLKLTAAVFFAIFFTVYATSGFVAGGTLLPQIFPGLSYQWSLIIIATFVVGYTFIGGLMAISWTDSIQGMMMLLAVFTLPIIVVSTMGGWANVAAEIPDGWYNVLQVGGEPLGWRSVVSDVAWGLGYFGMPHILIKLIAIKKEKNVSRSAVIAIVWVVLALGSAVMVGLVGRAFVPGLANSETVFINMITAIFLDRGALWATLVGALFLCGMFAAIKSTADSQLLVASSALSDIYRQADKKASDKKLVWISRAAVLLVAVLALVFALNSYVHGGYDANGVRIPGTIDRNSGVMALVAMAWAGFGSAFGPLVLCSLFWKRTNRVGAVAGVIVGGLTVIVWQYISIGGATLAAQTGIFSLVPGFALSLIAIIVGSLVTRKPSAEMLEQFATAQKPLIED